MKLSGILYASLLLALPLSCSKKTGQTTEPKLPRAVVGPAEVKVTPVPLVFFFGDDYQRLFIRLSGENWQPEEAALGRPELSHHRDVVAVSRVTAQKSPHSGTQIDIYRNSVKACSRTVQELRVLSRAYPQFGAREELGVSNEQGQVLKPKFDELLPQSSHVLSAVFDDCGTRGGDPADELVWARPSALGEPVIWTRLEDEAQNVREWSQRVGRLVMAEEFGRLAAEYAKASPDEQMTITTAVFQRPGAGHYLVEDFRQVGETTCGGDGHEVWTLWLVVDGKPALVATRTARQRVLLVADLDHDGNLEIVTIDGHTGNERTLYRLRDGMLERIKADKYPFNGCTC
jgi:hypothetical protein